nr:MAG TPA: hypothetical protein [Caudoviricetes sp.]
MEELTDNERPLEECNHVEFWVTLISENGEWCVYHFDKNNNYLGKETYR